MKHPLTDRICHEIVDGKDCSKYRAEYTHYFVEDYMRGAADWQLEKVIKWLKATESTVKLCPSLLADQLEQAMRPQENNSCPQPQWWTIPTPRRNHD